MDFKNPTPVTVCLVEVVNQHNEPYLLGVRRSIEPQVGGIALPGGYVDENESAETAASRELEEETGLFIPVEAWHCLGTEVTPQNRLLIFCMANYPVSSDLLDTFVANSEVSELVLIDCDTEVCFPLHQKWVDMYYDSMLTDEDDGEHCEDCACNGCEV